MAVCVRLMPLNRTLKMVKMLYLMLYLPYHYYKKPTMRLKKYLVQGNRKEKAVTYN